MAAIKAKKKDVELSKKLSLQSGIINMLDKTREHNSHLPTADLRKSAVKKQAACEDEDMSSDRDCSDNSIAMYD